MSCQTTNNDEAWEPRLYMSDANNSGIRRLDDKISCGDTRMKDYICMSKYDMMQLYARCLQPKKKKEWWRFGF